MKKAYLWLYNDNFITLELQWLTQIFHQTKRRNSIRCWISSRMWGWYTLDVSSFAPSYWKMVTTVMFYEKSEVFIVSKANVNNSKKNRVFVNISIIFLYLWTKNHFQYFHYQWFKTLSNKILGIHTTLNIIQNVRTVYVRRFRFSPFILQNGSSNFIQQKSFKSLTGTNAGKTSNIFAYDFLQKLNITK